MRHGSHMCLCGQIGPCGGIIQGTVGHFLSTEYLFLQQDLASGSGYFQLVSLQWSGMVSVRDDLA